MKKEKLINIEDVKIGMLVSLPASLKASGEQIKVNSIKKDNGYITVSSKGGTNSIKRKIGAKVSV